MWLVSWHWKHLSLSLDMVLTNEVGIKVDVICCAAWSFSTSSMVSARLCGPFLYTLVARVCAFFRPWRNILMVVASLPNLHPLASCLKWWIYAAKDSLSDCWISIKHLIDVWMSVFEIFKQRQSLISFQVFCAVKASDINVLINPLDFACANFVLLLPVNSEAVSMSVSQSSSCEESCPFNMGISCNKELSKEYFLLCSA